MLIANVMLIGKFSLLSRTKTLKPPGLIYFLTYKEAKIAFVEKSQKDPGRSSNFHLGGATRAAGEARAECVEKSFDLRPALIFKKASTSADCYVLQVKIHYAQ